MAKAGERRQFRAGPATDAVLKSPVIRPTKRRQAGLFDDPMPDRIEPCLALLVQKPPVGDWAYEVKWDGYRLAVHVGPGRKLSILTRRGHDWTSRFPAIAAAARDLEADTAILDGEAVVLNERGFADFGALQKALGGRGGRRGAREALLYAFDLLYLNGHDLRAMPLEERRQMLIELIGDGQGAIRLSEEIEAEGKSFLDKACEMGLEGIIAKKRDAPYRSGRGGDWLKIKCVQSETFLIVGYEPSTAALGGLGRLLLAARKGDGLVYVGGVGTGFGYAGATALVKIMRELTVSKPPFPLRRKNAIWITPALPVEIEFRGWTDDGMLRHSSYKGLREEAEMGDVFEIAP